MPLKPGSLFASRTAGLSAFMDALADAVAVLRDREVRCTSSASRPLDHRDEALKGDHIVSELVRCGFLEKNATGRLADLIVRGSSLSPDGIAALRDVVMEWLGARLTRLMLPPSSIEARLISSRLAAAAAMVVERSVREVAMRVLVGHVGAVPLPRRRGELPPRPSDYLLVRAAWTRELEEPGAVMAEAERAILEGRDAIRRIRRRRADAARPSKSSSRRRKPAR